jgi:hypothetical protein
MLVLVATPALRRRPLKTGYMPVSCRSTRGLTPAALSASVTHLRPSAETGLGSKNDKAKGKVQKAKGKVQKAKGKNPRAAMRRVEHLGRRFL